MGGEAVYQGGPVLDTYEPVIGDAIHLGTGPGWQVNMHEYTCSPGTSNTRSCRVADLGWRLGRVYFLAFLNPSRGQPDPALTARLASPATVDEATTELD